MNSEQTNQLTPPKSSPENSGSSTLHLTTITHEQLFWPWLNAAILKKKNKTIIITNFHWLFFLSNMERKIQSLEKTLKKKTPKKKTPKPAPPKKKQIAQRKNLSSIFLCEPVSIAFTYIYFIFFLPWHIRAPRPCHKARNKPLQRGELLQKGE